MSRRAGFDALVGVCVLLATGARAQESHWEPLAFSGRPVFSAAVPPDSATVVYATAGSIDGQDPTGVYRSDDGGVTWRFLGGSASEQAHTLTIDPQSQATVFCGSAAILFDPNFPGDYPRRTRDAGLNWETILAPLDRIVASPFVQGLLIATHRGEGWDLWRSDDDGQTWSRLCGLAAGTLSDNVIFDRSDSLTVFAPFVASESPGDPRSLAKSVNGGLTWDTILSGHIGAFDLDLLLYGHLAAVVLDEYGMPDRLAESLDGGTTWESWGLPALGGFSGAYQLVFDPRDANVLYVAANGVWRSPDGGHTWTPMETGFPSQESVFQVLRAGGAIGPLWAARWDGLWMWVEGQGSEIGPSRSTLRIESVFPSPFRSAVQAQIRHNPGSLHAEVRALSGAVVRSLRVLPGTELSRVVWDGRGGDGSDAPPGVYVMTVASPSERACLPIVKLR